MPNGDEFPARIKPDEGWGVRDNDAGKVTAELAKAYAESKFEKYRIVQDRLFESDFDKLLKQLE